MRVSVVIVNWNAGEALAACLDSVAADPPRDGPGRREVIVVDNASEDASLGLARGRVPAIRLVETGSNLGFAAGANRGAEVASGEVLVFLNPDARVRPGAIDALVDALATVPGAGIAGGGLRDTRDRWQPGSARFGPVRHLLLDTTPGRLALRRRRTPLVVEWVYGTFMAVRRDAFARLGGFDASYFCYGEDMDLCHRAARLGVRTIHVPGAIAEHGQNVSATRRFGNGREAAVVGGELRFYARRGGPLDVPLFRTLGIAKFGTKAALAAVTGRPAAARVYGRVVRACLAPVAA